MKKRSKSREDLKSKSFTTYHSPHHDEHRGEVYRSESRELLRGGIAAMDTMDTSSHHSDHDDDSEIMSEYEMNELEHSMSIPNFFPIENRSVTTNSWNVSKSEMASPLPFHNPHVVNTISVVSILLYITTAAIIYVVYYTDLLVYVPPISAISKDPSVFNHIQARHYLRQLVAFGPRVVGSKVNEKQVPMFLHKELLSIQENLAKSTDSNLEVDIQRKKNKLEQLSSFFLC